MTGQIVILNGAPRSGKSSIAAVIQETFDGAWMNLGVDVVVRHATPPALRPGIGLRPGGERPDLEPFVVASYAGLYASVAAHAREGLNVVVDVGHHDAYSRPLGILGAAARRLAGMPVLLVGLRCPLDVILARRAAAAGAEEPGYVIATADDPVPEPVRRWQEEVHRPGIYDLEVDTSVLSPEACAEVIRRRLADGPPGDALDRMARDSRGP